MISKVECDGVCICIVYPTLWPGGTAEFVDHPALSIVPSVFMSESVRFLWLRHGHGGLPPRPRGFFKVGLEVPQLFLN